MVLMHSAYTLAGRVPVNALLSSDSSFRFTRLPMEAGTVPTRPAPAKRRWMRFTSSPRELGRVPSPSVRHTTMPDVPW